MNTWGLPRFIALALSLVLLLATPGGAQTTGSISGRATNPAGDALPGVTVEATSPNLQGTRTAVTDRDGRYRLPSTPPGTYRVRASLDGFRPIEVTTTVSLDATATVDLTLQITAEEKVLVSGDAPGIDKTSTTTGTNYASEVIAHLPVSRNYADIVKSNPGVSTDRGETQGRSLALAIYGATSAENQWIIDGVNTTGVFKGVQGKAINNEFVQEVEVKTGGYQAEYGRALGGVVNVITKSGGNVFHGEGFVYYDSTATAAEKRFEPGDSGISQTRFAAGKRFDYGADLGGFLVKDRLWFFGAYNRVTLDAEVSRVQASLHVSTEDRFPVDTADNLYSGKLTWNAAPSTTVVGTIFADPSSVSGAAGADPRQGLGDLNVEPPVSLDPSTWSSSRSLGGTDFGVRLTQLFGSAVILALQGGYHRDRNSLTAPDGIRTINETCAGGTPELPCEPPPEPNAISGGYGVISAISDNTTSSRRQYAANLTTYAGAHEIKAGADYMDGRTDGEGSYTGGQVVWIENEFGQRYYIHEFLGSDPENPTIAPGIHRRAQVLDYGVFVQDSWRATPGLTINLGARWDGETARNFAGRSVLRLNHQWQPRVGVIWDPWSDGRTRFYASAGRFSYALPTVAAAMAFTKHPGRLQTYNFDPVGIVQDPNVLNHEEAVVDVPAAPQLDSVDAGIRAPSQDELTIGVERLLAPTLTVGLKGTYRTLTRTIEDRCDFDSSFPETNYSECALVNPGSSGKFARGDAPACNGLVDFYPDYYECSSQGPPSPDPKRIYRGIELVARESVSNRLWIQASYVFSSLRGNYDGGVNQGAWGDTAPGWNSDFDYPALWHNASGTLALDRPHRFRLDAYWATPWHLSIGLQAFAESGAPLNKTGYFSFWYGSHVFLEPRGSVGRLPTLWGADLTVSYPVVLGPVTVTFQAYLFNVFNKQIATSRDDAWSINPPAGFPDTLYDPNQENNNPYYGSITGRQQPRMFRAALRVSF